MSIELSGALLVAVLQQDTAPSKIPSEYANYDNIFSLNLVIQLPENSDINEHAIKLVEGKQLSTDASIAYDK